MHIFSFFLIFHCAARQGKEENNITPFKSFVHQSSEHIS